MHEWYVGNRVRNKRLYPPTNLVFRYVNRGHAISDNTLIKTKNFYDDKVEFGKHLLREID